MRHAEPKPMQCVATGPTSMTLISRAGFHCDVWRFAGRLRRFGRERQFDYVFKQYRGHCSYHEARVFKRDYERLRSRLRAMVPKAIFVLTQDEGEQRLVVLAHTCNPWFDLANPGNEETARALLRRYRGTRAELARFVKASFEWLEAADARMIDLHGHGNLVIDTSYHVRYIDSFGCFFYPDMIDAVGSGGEDVADIMRICTQRLMYLRRLLRFTRDPQRRD